MVSIVEQLTAALAGLLIKNETPAAPASATLRDFEQRSLVMEKIKALLFCHKELRRAACRRLLGSIY
jgi:hypothetical protein